MNLLDEVIVALAEGNDCHNPPGSPDGGKFCSSGGEQGQVTWTNYKKYGLKENEIDAIRTYLGSVRSERRRASVQADLSRALAKMPAWEGVAYHGRKGDRARGIKVGSEVTLDRLTSASKLPSVGERFARGDRMEGTRDGSIFRITTRNGRDLTGFGDAEKEVMLLKGAKFKVTSVDRSGKFPIIRMTEIRSLTEGNDCHNPAGEGGGQFCSAGTSGQTSDRPIPRNRTVDTDRIAIDNIPQRNPQAGTRVNFNGYVKPPWIDRAAELAGGQPGTQVTVYEDWRDAPGTYLVEFTNTGVNGSLRVDDPGGIYFEELYVNHDVGGDGYTAPHGTGMKIMAGTIKAARDLGMSDFRLKAAGSLGSSMNGYYTWPRMGFEGKLTDDQVRDVYDTFGVKVKTVQDVFELPEIPKEVNAEGTLEGRESGRIWWKENGEGFSAKFDMKDGSRSMKRMGRYLKERFGRNPFGPLNEVNDCHNPAGTSEGGQFCSSEGLTSALGDAGLPPLSKWWTSTWASSSDPNKPGQQSQFQMTLNPDGKSGYFDMLQLANAGKGQGTKIFAALVADLKKQGVETLKGRPTGAKNLDMNGYYSSAMWGFDAPIPNVPLTGMSPEWAQEHFKDPSIKTVQDILAKPGGPEWWKENGGGFHGVFDLRDGSRSMRQLQKYMKGKGLTEANDCHNPAGTPKGGQFCSTPGTGPEPDDMFSREGFGTHAPGVKDAGRAFRDDLRALAKQLNHEVITMRDANAIYSFWHRMTSGDEATRAQWTQVAQDWAARHNTPRRIAGRRRAAKKQAGRYWINATGAALGESVEVLVEEICREPAGTEEGGQFASCASGGVPDGGTATATKEPFVSSMMLGDEMPAFVATHMPDWKEHPSGVNGMRGFMHKDDFAGHPYIFIDERMWYTGPQVNAGEDKTYPVTIGMTERARIARFIQETMTHVPEMNRLAGGALVAVNFKVGPNPDDPYWAKTYGVSSFTSAATGGNREVTFYGPGMAINEAREIFAHEVGHLVSLSGTNDWRGDPAREAEFAAHQVNYEQLFNVAAEAKWGEMSRGGPRGGQPGYGSLTPYGSMNWKEDFAELYRLAHIPLAPGHVEHDPAMRTRALTKELKPSNMLEQHLIDSGSRIWQVGGAWADQVVPFHLTQRIKIAEHLAGKPLVSPEFMERLQKWARDENPKLKDWWRTSSPTPESHIVSLAGTPEFEKLSREVNKVNEGNDCHNPAGTSDGGQFCSEGGGVNAHGGTVASAETKFGYTTYNIKDIPQNTRSSTVLNTAKDVTIDYFYGRTPPAWMKDAALLSGAPDGSNVHVNQHVNYGANLPSYEHNVAIGGNYRISFSDAGIHGTLDVVGKKLYLEWMEIGENLQKQSFGTKIFASQIKAARDGGFTDFELVAAGHKTGSMNGYYTWPRLGVDGDIRPEDVARVREKFGKVVKTVQDVMDIPGGREWWQENGRSFQGTFDLRDGSRSMKRLGAYMKAKFGHNPFGAINEALALIVEAICRVPAGNPDGGQFTDCEGGADGGDPESVVVKDDGKGGTIIMSDEKDDLPTPMTDAEWKAYQDTEFKNRMAYRANATAEMSKHGYTYEAGFDTDSAMTFTKEGSPRIIIGRDSLSIKPGSENEKVYFDAVAKHLDMVPKMQELSGNSIKWIKLGASEDPETIFLTGGYIVYAKAMVKDGGLAFFNLAEPTLASKDTEGTFIHEVGHLVNLFGTHAARGGLETPLGQGVGPLASPESVKARVEAHLNQSRYDIGFQKAKAAQFGAAGMMYGNTSKGGFTAYGSTNASEDFAENFRLAHLPVESWATDPEMGATHTVTRFKPQNELEHLIANHLIGQVAGQRGVPIHIQMRMDAMNALTGRELVRKSYLDDLDKWLKAHPNEYVTEILVPGTRFLSETAEQIAGDLCRSEIGQFASCAHGGATAEAPRVSMRDAWRASIHPSMKDSTVNSAKAHGYKLANRTTDDAILVFEKKGMPTIEIARDAAGLEGLARGQYLRSLDKHLGLVPEMHALSGNTISRIIFMAGPDPETDEPGYTTYAKADGRSGSLGFYNLSDPIHAAPNTKETFIHEVGHLVSLFDKPGDEIASRNRHTLKYEYKQNFLDAHVDRFGMGAGFNSLGGEPMRGGFTSYGSTNWMEDFAENFALAHTSVRVDDDGETPNQKRFKPQNEMENRIANFTIGSRFGRNGLPHYIRRRMEIMNKLSGKDLVRKSFLDDLDAWLKSHPAGHVLSEALEVIAGQLCRADGGLYANCETGTASVDSETITRDTAASPRVETESTKLAPELYSKVARVAAGKGSEVKLTSREIKEVLHDGVYGIIGAGRSPLDKDWTPEKERERYNAIIEEAKAKGYRYMEAKGKYGQEEPSILVFIPEAQKKDIVEMGKRFNQDSVIWGNQGKQRMIFTTGEKVGKGHPGRGYKNIVSPEQLDFFTEIPARDGPYKFALKFNFNRLVERLRRMFGPEVLNEFIKRVSGGFRVVSHQTGKNFGTYKSKGAAARRLRQMARFR